MAGLPSLRSAGHCPSRPPRLVVAAVLVAALTATACGAAESDTPSGDGTGTVRWIYDFFPTSGDLPMLAAQENGYFSEAGLTVETTAGGEANQIQSVGTGQHDITVGPAVTLLLSREQGLPVVSVGVVQPLNPAGLICNPRVGLDPNDPTTLAGHRIGVNSADADSAISWEPFRNAHGLTGQVEEIQTNYDLTALFSGQVDCYPNFLTLDVARAEDHFGQPPVTYRSSEAAGALGQVLVASERFAAENPELVRKFVAAYAKGMQWTLQNPGPAVDLMSKSYPDNDPAATTDELPLLVEYWTTQRQETDGLLYADASDWQPTVDSLVELGYLSSAPDLASSITTEFLPTDPVTP